MNLLKDYYTEQNIEALGFILVSDDRVSRMEWNKH